MSVLNSEDSYEFELLLDLSKRVKKYMWGSSISDFLVHNNSRFVEETIPIELIRRIDSEISDLLGQEVDSIDYREESPILQTINDCFRVEERKEFTSELEKAKQELEYTLGRPNSKSRKKDIRHRLTKLQKRIDDHNLGLENVFLTREEVFQFKKQNNVNINVFEYTTIIPLMMLGDKFEQALDIIEREGVPNVDLFRGLPKRTKEAFHDNWLVGNFFPQAGVYIIGHREDAIEDIMRRIPAIENAGFFYQVPNPDFDPIINDSKTQARILELGLPLEKTKEFLLSGSGAVEYVNPIYSHRNGFLFAATDFYREQLSHKDWLLRWIAVTALVGAAIAGEDGNDNTRPEMTLKKDLDAIVESLDIDSRYPNLSANRSILVKRFVKYTPSYNIKDTDPYKLETLDRIIPLTKKARRILARYDVNINIDVFCRFKGLNETAKALEWINENVDTEEYRALADNKYFTKFLNSYSFNIEMLLEKEPHKISLYFKPLADISVELSRMSNDMAERRFEEMNEFIFDRVGFDEDALKTYEIYVNFLGKDFTQFMRDFKATGGSLKKLPEIKRKYSQFFNKDRFRSMLNYVTRKKSRDLIENLLYVDNIHHMTTLTVVDKLDSGASKKDIINVLVELNKTHYFLSHVGALYLLDKKLESAPEGIDVGKFLSFFADIRRESYSNVIGEDVDVPDELSEMLDNIVVAYYNNESNGHIDMQSALKLITSTYLAEGSEASFNALRELEDNKTLRRIFSTQGVDINAFETGITRTYHLTTDTNQLERIKERIKSEFRTIYDRMRLLDIDDSQFSALQEASVTEQLAGVEKLLKEYKFTDETADLKNEIKGHIHTVKSVGGTMKEMEDDVEFYVSTDPFEALHMGQFFHSCLSLTKNHGGVNAWASVVQVMDSNKNVIYAKGSNGNYVARNRTVLTDKGILCTSFYQNGNLFTESAWIDYLTAYGQEVGQDVLIPSRFASSIMQRKLDKLSSNGKVIKEERVLLIEPAYSGAFYGDGLLTSRLDDGRTRVKAEVYVIKT